MQKIYEYLGIPFGFIIFLFYSLTGNYILSIFFLLLLVRICLLPSAIKQQKGIAMQQRLQPKLRRIREKYGNDQQKIQQETQELYQKEGFSAMGGGCLPMLIQLPVMLGLYQVNLHPFSMVLRIDSSVVSQLKQLGVQFATNAYEKSEYRSELTALMNWDKLDLSSVTGLTQEMIGKIELFISRFTFMGLDLSRTPNFKEFNIYWIIPIVSGIIALVTSVYSLIRQKKTNPEMAKNPTMGCMMLFTPAMQIYFAFLFPISIGIYIIMSSAISLVQMIVLNHVYSPKKVLAKVMVDEAVYRRSKEENTKKINEFKND
ncbi:MAG: YidC/Oxa1 family membrane protein insertase [Ruminococcaceae bacterium]|nr:YidC/Oxa1 family membrane protein insertase [Oscillospiraceae bacterium]